MTSSHRPSPPRHRPKRRLDPAQVLGPILELPAAERLELYAERYEALIKGAGRHEGLRSLAEQLAAATEVLGAAAADGQLVTLAAVRVAGSWRSRPMPPGPHLFPRIATTASYFDTPSGMLHWLDLDDERIAEALECAQDRPPRHSPHHSSTAEAALVLVADTFIAQAPHDPVGTAANPLLARVIVALTAAAHRGSRHAAAQFAELTRALCPDFRAARPARRPRHTPRWRLCRADLADLRAGVQEEQEAFRRFCAEQEPSRLPPPLRAGILSQCAGAPPSRGPY